MTCPVCGSEDIHVFANCMKGDGDRADSRAVCLNPDCRHWWTIKHSAPAVV